MEMFLLFKIKDCLVSLDLTEVIEKVLVDFQKFRIAETNLKHHHDLDSWVFGFLIDLS